MNQRFDKFDEQVRQALTLAQEEATRLGHTYIATEHLLLGILRCEGSGALTVLAELAVETEPLRGSVEVLAAREDAPPLGEVGLTPRAKRVIELAVDEARRLGHHSIGTEHLLLGMLRQEEGFAFAALTSQGVTLEAAGAGVARMHEADAKASGALDAGAPPERSANERFDKFTERARRVLTLAHEEATRFNHNYIGTEHLLLGLVREEEGVAARVLANLGVGLNRVRSAVEFIIGRGDRPAVGEVGLTPRAKRVIELAVDEARRLGHHYIGTEHLLLGLVREGEGIASGVLESLGVNLERVRTQTIQVLSQTVHGPVHGGESGSSAAEDMVRPAVVADTVQRLDLQAIHSAAEEAADTAAPSSPPVQRPVPQAPGIEYLVIHVGLREGAPVVLQVDGLADPAAVPTQAPLQQALTLLGAGGWNLAGIDRPARSSDQDIAFYIFSRRLLTESMPPGEARLRE